MATLYCSLGAMRIFFQPQPSPGPVLEFELETLQLQDLLDFWSHVLPYYKLYLHLSVNLQILLFLWLFSSNIVVLCV